MITELTAKCAKECEVREENPFLEFFAVFAFFVVSFYCAAGAWPWPRPDSGTLLNVS